MMVRFHFLTSAILIWLFTSSVWAQECAEGAVTASQKLVFCAAEDAFRSLKDVDYFFQKLIINVTMISDIEVALKSPRATPFLQSQKVWSDFINTTCFAEATFYEGGTLQRKFESDCVTRLAKQRLDYLKELLERPKG